MKLVSMLSLGFLAASSAVAACGSGTTPDCSDASVCELSPEVDGSMSMTDSGNPRDTSTDQAEETAPAEGGGNEAAVESGTGMDSGGKDSGMKDTGTKDTGSKDSGGKDGSDG